MMFTYEVGFFELFNLPKCYINELEITNDAFHELSASYNTIESIRGICKI